MDKCLRCGDFIWANEKVVFGKDKHYLCGSCTRMNVNNILRTKKDTINVYLKQGNKIIFGDANDYFIDNDNGWLNIYKDGKKRATLKLSHVESVIVE